MTRSDTAWTGASLRRAVSLGPLAWLGEAAIRLGATSVGLVIDFAGGPPGTEVFDLHADSLARTNVALRPDVQIAMESASKPYRGMAWRSPLHDPHRAGR